MQSRCETCAWRDLEPARVINGRVDTVDVCLYSKPQFPKAKDCDGYLHEANDDE